MGAQQGGILSTDLYKLYINPLLDRLQDVSIGQLTFQVLYNIDIKV